MQFTITSILALAIACQCAHSIPVSAPLHDSSALAVSAANNNNPSISSTKGIDTTDRVQNKKGGFKKFWKISSGITGAFGSALTAGSAADQIKQRHDQQN